MMRMATHARKTLYRLCSLLLCFAILLEASPVMAGPMPMPAGHAVARPQEDPPQAPLAAPPISTEIALVPGWNLISSPLVLTNPSPAVALTSIAGHYNSIYSYAGCDSADPWKSFDPANVGSGDLTGLNETQGLWIDVTVTDTLVLSGTRPTTVTIPLCQGWNLIGYPFPQAQPVNAALSSIAGEYVRVFTRDAGDHSDPWEAFDVGAPGWANDVTILEPGRGYWVYAKNDVSLTMSAPPQNADILPPRVALTVTPPVVNVGQPVTIRATASDDLHVASLRVTVNDTLITLNGANQGQYIPATPGLYTVRAVAQDNAGNITSKTDYFSARTAIDNGAPSAVLMAPDDGAAITKTTQLVGTAADTDLAYYELRISVPNRDSSEYGIISTGFTGVINGALGQLDPGRYIPGLYDVRVCAVDSWGNETCSVPKRYDVSTPRPTSGFTNMSYLDGYLDAIGLPVAARRIYDSRRKTSGDFGFGWTLDYDAIKFSVDGVMGDDWEIQVTNQGFRFNLVPSRPHRVVISLPDGSVQRFELRFQPNSQIFIPIRYLNGVFFDPLPGTNSTLAPNFPQPGFDTFNLFVDPETTHDGPVTVYYFDGLDLKSYDPTGYTLTMQDGRTFTFSGGSGQPFKLVQASDTNGNTLTFGPGGIIHSNGEGVSLTRDGEGRITKMRLSDGRERTYSYDSHGDLVSATDYAGYTTTFVYDDNHNLLQILDPRGHTPGTLVYDEEGRIIGVIDSQGQRVNLTHDNVTNQEVVTDRLGNTTIRQYDTAGNLIATTDPLGNSSYFTYDSRGNMLTRTDPLGNVDSFTFDAHNHQTSYTNALGNTWSKSYDAEGHLLSESDPLSHTVTYDYSARGNLTTIITARGGEHRLAYDTQGNIMAYTDPMSGTLAVTRDANGRMASYTDPLGRQSLVTTRPDGQTAHEEFTLDGQIVAYDYTYDANGGLRSVTLPDGHSSQMNRDSAGMPVGTVNPLGDTQSVTYDDSNNLATFTNYDGGTSQIQRDAEERITGVTGPQGERTAIELDPLGRTSSVTLATGSVVSVTYDAAGRIATRQSSSQGETVYGYNAAGRVITETNSEGGHYLYGWDAANQMVAITNPVGIRTEFTYDADGNMESTRFADGNAIQVDHDLDNRPIRMTNERGASMNFGYDVAGQLVSVTNPLGDVTQYQYNELSNVVTATMPSGNQWGYSYDGLGRVTGMQFPWGGAESYTLNATGNMTRAVDATGAETLFAFDPMNRLLTRTLAGGEVESFTHDYGNHLLAAGDSTGQTNYSYDTKGRLARVDNPDGSFVEYTYDAANQLATLHTPGGTTSYRYNGEGRMIEADDSAAGTTTYGYDLAGRLTAMTLPDGSTTTLTYNNRGWITHMVTVAADNTTVMRDETVDYDASGNPLHSGEAASGRQVAYDYDMAGRVTGEDRSGGSDAATLAYSYDDDWNLTQKGAQTLAYDGHLRLTGDGIWSSYSYDAAGRPTSRRQGAVTEHFTYDSLGRLVRLDRSGATPALVQLTYNYDGLLVRIDADGVVRHLLWETASKVPQLLEERSDDGTLLRRYVRGLNAIAVQEPATTRVLHQDYLGSVRMLTDLSGAVVANYAFDAYGEQSVGNIDSSNLLGFAGEYYVPEIGLYYLRARFYDPGAGRFLTPDLLPPDPKMPSSYNPYLYVGGNPVRFTDPLGNFGMAEISAALSISSIILSIALPYFPGPVLLFAKQLGFETDLPNPTITAISLYVSLNKGIASAGVQFDVYSGPTTTMFIIWLFIGVGISTSDPRVAGSAAVSATFWAGFVVGSPTDPSTPRAGFYVMFSNSLARVLVNAATRSQGINLRTYILNYKRDTAAVQFEVAGVDTQGAPAKGGAFSFSFSIYSEFFGLGDEFFFDAAALKAGPKKAYGGGISFSFYLPLIWATWDGAKLTTTSWINEANY